MADSAGCVGKSKLNFGICRMSDSTIQRFNGISVWLRLVRWPNLLIVGATQLVAWWCVIYPVSGPKVLVPLKFLLLCVSTMLIAAAGYIINDYFDIRIDAINKPGKVILEKEIPRRLAIIVHSALNVVALGLAALVAVPARHPEWLLLQLLCTGLLWRYSTTWKRQFVIGNAVVALMTALTIVALIIYEPAIVAPGSIIPGWHLVFGRTGNGKINPLLALLTFSAFAFLLTWMREIVKDMEDYKGDDAEGCVTMPIRWGLLRSTRFVQALGMLAIAMLCFAMTALWRIANGWSLSAIYVLLALVVPLVLWILALPKTATVANYHLASIRIKLIMVSGVISLLLLKLLNYG